MGATVAAAAVSATRHPRRAPPVEPGASSSKAPARAGRGFGEPKPKPLKLPAAPKGCRSIGVTSKADGSLWQVLAGKSAPDNDRLSLEIGQAHEPWMHVAGVPGSHVVVRAVGADSGATRQPPQDVLQTAAGICAYYSKSKLLPQVKVHLTKCGKVGKIPGAPAGMVLLTGGWDTLTVRPLNPAFLDAAGGAGAAAASPSRRR